MIEELKLIEIWLLKTDGLCTLNIRGEAECKEYDGYNFNVGTFKIKYRKAKITPKKIGQFVTLSASIAVLWKPDDQITQWAL